MYTSSLCQNKSQQIHVIMWPFKREDCDIYTLPLHISPSYPGHLLSARLHILTQVLLGGVQVNILKLFEE
jgi:hypothetical protein